MDLLQQLFLNDARRLRSGWRLGIFAGLFIVLMFGVTGALRVIYVLAINFAPAMSVPDHLADIVFRLTFLGAALAAGYICSRVLEGLPWRSLGLTLHARWLRDLLLGSLIGIVSLALATAIAFVGGGLRFSLSPMPIKSVATTVLLSGGLFIVAALAEEALFRGYPLQTLARAGLIWLGVFLTSVPFAAIHLDNPNAGGVLAFVNTALAGVWLAVAYLKTRSLWFPLGVHWAWNWALGALFGLPVSGITKVAPNPILIGSDLGPAWLTGARYGIEGGVACTIALVISIIYIWKTGLVSPDENLKRLTSQENPVSDSQPYPVDRQSLASPMQGDKSQPA
ncbi:MAG: CPBP family intramembrane glutamic endopeptidase [Pyrinomonadaceae bacterium]